MIGKKLAHYEITSELGKGGMGEVWRARDTKLGREVAIKTLPEDFAADEGRLARFEREARLLASLNHPNIAAIYGLETSQSTRFLVLELVEGETLAERLKRSRLSVEESLSLARQIVDALEAAHARGVIHRDLKPANIKLTPDGKIKVLDFGLAKALTDEVVESDLASSPTLSMQATRHGVILGTAAYMSPEQARGEAADKRSDIWAFGCVLFEMLSGRTVFEGRTASDVLAGVLRAEPDWGALPPNLHPRLRELLERCLEKEVKNRWHDIGDVRVDLDKILEDREPPSHGTAGVEPRPLLPWVATTFAVTSAAVALAVWNLKPPEPKAVVRFVHDLPRDQSLSSARESLAISPDGARLIYAANDQLYLRRMDESIAHPIAGTSGTTGRARNPFFSPDGEWVAYWADGQLKKIAVGGGVPSPICEEAIPPFGAVWHEDDTIVYGRDGGAMRVSANGGTPEPLISEGGVRGPMLLPGGETVLFTVLDEEGGHIAVESLASGERKLLLEGGKVRYVPTGHLIYGRGGTLFAVPFDVDSLELRGGPVALVEDVKDSVHFAASETGTLVYVDGGEVEDRRVLALADRNGTVEMLDVPPAEYLSPRLSPDGDRLVVQSFQDGEGVLWIYDLSGERAIRQFTFEGDNRRPIWTPDGERVTFASDRDGSTSLYWKPADGGDAAERLTTAEEGISHWPSSWSPDGQVLAYMVQEGIGQQADWDVWTLSLGDHATEILYDVPDKVHIGPVFSPDGRWIAYGYGDAPATQDVYVEPFPPTGARQRISQNGGLWAMWSRAGTELFYRPSVSVGAEAGVSLRVVEIATEPDFGFSNERELPLGGFVVVGYYRDYDITPDGEKLLMVVPEGAAESSAPPPPRIHVVLNWFEELEERVPR